jgi:hypothetical protein
VAVELGSVYDAVLGGSARDGWAEPAPFRVWYPPRNTPE